MLDLTGKTFGKLTVLQRAENKIYPSGRKKRQWLCVCTCGKQTLAMSEKLINGRKKSCGCFKDEHKKKHNQYGTRLYHIWNAMLQRCENSKTVRFDRYGGRGITVCDEWYDFKVFYNWAMSHGYKDDLTIDRIDGDGNYEPSNCRWATYSEQNKNKKKIVKG